MLKRALVFVSVVGLPIPLLAQGPIFLTSPNTLPLHDLNPSLSYVRQGSETDVNLQAMYGLHSKVSIGFGMLMVAEAGGPLEVGRVQSQVKVRLFQRTGDGKRSVVGFTTGVGLPVGESVGRVARSTGVSNLVASLTAAHAERRVGFTASVSGTVDVYETENRPTSTAGVAVSWRPVPAAPGATSGPGFTLFVETLGHYEANHSGWVGIAPGVMYRTGRTQLKLGLRVPVQRWNSHSQPLLSLATSMFIPVRSSRP